MFSVSTNSIFRCFLKSSALYFGMGGIAAEEFGSFLLQPFSLFQFQGSLQQIVHPAAGGPRTVHLHNFGKNAGVNLKPSSFPHIEEIVS